MGKKTKRFIIAAIISIVFSVGAILIIVPAMFSAQYNKNGISHYLVVTIDETPRTYVGELEGHSVYIERLNIPETNFRSIKAENVSIKEAIDKGLVSIDEWKKHAFRTVKRDNYDILKFDNYEIAINKKECIIRPLSK